MSSAHETNQHHAPQSVGAQKTGRHIAFNKPAFIGTELEEIAKAIQTHHQISGMGHYTKACEIWLETMYQAPVHVVSSCTHALEIAALLLDLSPSDEVLMPSFTFVSTANAFALRGLSVRFADCDQYGQLDLAHVKKQLTPQTKAICVVHYAGNSTDMEALVDFCRQHNLILIEDAAQAIGATYKGKPLGTWGDLGCLSFHETKNVTSGEGGALIINNPAMLERAHYIREKGTNRTQFMQGMVDKYTWVDIGSSYVLSELNAAHLWIQLQHFEKIHAKRKMLWERYADSLGPALSDIGATMLNTPPGNDPNYHIFAIVFAQAAQRSEFIDYMRQRGITAPFHYVALHSSPMGQRMGSFPDEAFLNTNRLATCLVRLPLFYNMEDSEQDWVITSVLDFCREQA